MSSASSSSNRIKRFDGSHYLAWRNRVYTDLQCEDLTELVDLKPNPELKKKSYGTEKKPLTWSQADAKARKIIIENLEDSMLHYAPTDTSAYEVWRKLKVTYNRTSYLQHAYLRRRLSNLQYDGKGELSAFFSEFEEIVGEIRSSGGKIGKMEEVESVVILLAALPSEYSPVIASFGEVNENSLLTLETVKGSLLDYDLKRKDERKSRKVESEPTGSAYVSESTPKGQQSEIVCDYCNRSGHRESRCFKKKNDLKKAGEKKGSESNVASDRQTPRAVTFLVEGALNVEGNSTVTAVNAIEFVVDSGCTRFMVNSDRWFTQSTKLAQPIVVSLADDRSTLATHSGTLDVVSDSGVRMTLTDVLYVPGLRRNLLSVKRIAAKGFSITFVGDKVEVSNGNGILASGVARGELYFLSVTLPASSANLGETDSSFVIAHRRLGHPHSSVLLQLRKEGVIKFFGDATAVCNSCIRGKMCQLPYPTSSFKTSRPLEQVVSDVCVAEVVGIGGYLYFVTFLDVHTHFCVVFPIRNKSDVFDKLREYEAMARNQFKTGICSFLCDNGREFINAQVIDFCQRKGIRLLNSVAHNHQQNGRAEHLNRTLEDKARTMLLEAGLPKWFWSEAVMCAAFLLNRCPTKATGKVPAVEWYGKPANYSRLRAFGCVCHVHVPTVKRKKFDPRSELGVLVGYSDLAYRIYMTEKKAIQLARNVVFEESRFYKDLLKTTTATNEQSDSDSSSGDEAQTQDAPDTASDVLNETLGDLPLPSAVSPRRSSRERRPPAHLSDYEVSVAVCETFLVQDANAPEWNEAKKAELESMEKFRVWDLVPRTKDMDVIRSKWALQQKPDKRKARLVAVGCQEKDAPDNLFAPVANMTTIKILLSIVVQLNLILHQMDVSNAFLHGDITYDVFMEQAPGFSKGKHLVCKLNRAIYGLKISPKIWNQCINDFLVTTLKFRRSEFDQCLYSKSDGSNVLYVLIYVDDLLLASNSLPMLKKFKKEISQKFNVVDLGECRRFLGMEITYNVSLKQMTLSQEDFIVKVAQKFNVHNSKPVYTPIEVDLNLVKSDESNVNLPFRQLVGCLLYISIISRPDVSYSVNYFSRFMNGFAQEHFTYLKRVLVYLYHTRHLKLTYTHSSEKVMFDAFVDADWASDSFDRKSVSGNVTRLYSNVIAWVSKKQGSIALSSTESEYISLSTYLHNTLFWILSILKEFQIEPEKPVRVYEDNQSVICLSQNPLTSKRSKHIDVRFKSVKEKVLNGEVKLEYVPSCSQLADGFTKALVRAKFEVFRDSLNVV